MRSSRSPLIFLVVTLALIAASCGSSDSSSSPGTGEPAATATPESDVDAPEDEAPTAAPEEPTAAAAPEPEPDPEPAPELAVRVPVDVIDPEGTGLRVIQPISNAVLPDGYTEQEWLFGGEATSYQEVGELGADGFWDAVEADTTPYRTRMIVRLPEPDRFSGVVLVEWFNVTAGTDTSPDWAFLSEEIEREGHGYIGVSVQAVGVNGTEGSFIEGGLIDTSGLINRDPERYGDLVHPGDAYSFDIYTQAGTLIKGQGDTNILQGLVASHVIALGESQSAAFMTTYVNTIHPLVDVYDGFLVHSRGTFGPTPSGERLSDEQAAVQHRTDLDVPVFVFEAETDVVGLGYFAARQDDSDNVVVWEVAGTAHADSYTLAQSIGVAPDATLGALIGCETINDGPHHEVVQAAVHHLVEWVINGTQPPPSPDLEVVDGALVRDEFGIAIGGIRTPPVDAPLRVLTGETLEEGACRLFGATYDLDPGVLAALYPDVASYVAAFETSAAEAVAAGWLLQVDADLMLERETARAEELLGAS